MNNDFTIRLGGKEQITYHGAHQEQDFHVTLVDTGQETMTGGRLGRIRKYVGNEPFLMTYGDGLADVDLNALIAFHKSHGRLATVTTVRPTSRFGIIELEPNSAVKKFVEKPRLDGWASVGFFVLQPEVLDLITGDDCIFEQEPLQALAAKGQLMGFQHEGFFYAMDTYREYKYLNDLWASGKAPWKVWE
jgi:glucose-1-phosphate cytidylyltransferase